MTGPARGALARAIEEADRPEHGGQGYHLRIRFADGTECCLPHLGIEGGCVRLELRGPDADGEGRRVLFVQDGPGVAAAWADWDAPTVFAPWMPGGGPPPAGPAAPTYVLYRERPDLGPGTLDAETDLGKAFPMTPVGVRFGESGKRHLAPAKELVALDGPRGIVAEDEGEAEAAVGRLGYPVELVPEWGGRLPRRILCYGPATLGAAYAEARSMSPTSTVLVRPTCWGDGRDLPTGPQGGPAAPAGPGGAPLGRAAAAELVAELLLIAEDFARTAAGDAFWVEKAREALSSVMSRRLGPQPESRGRWGVSREDDNSLCFWIAEANHSKVVVSFPMRPA